MEIFILSYGTVKMGRDIRDWAGMGMGKSLGDGGSCLLRVNAQ